MSSATRRTPEHDHAGRLDPDDPVLDVGGQSRPVHLPADASQTDADDAVLTACGLSFSETTSDEWDASTWGETTARCCVNCLRAATPATEGRRPEDVDEFVVLSAGTGNRKHAPAPDSTEDDPKPDCTARAKQEHREWTVKHPRAVMFRDPCLGCFDGVDEDE